MKTQAPDLKHKVLVRLPGEAKEDVDDGCCQVNALLPLLPQNSGQGSEDRLCHHRTHSVRTLKQRRIQLRRKQLDLKVNQSQTELS